jgi:hypothetical protein
MVYNELSMLEVLAVAGALRQHGPDIDCSPLQLYLDRFIWKHIPVSHRLLAWCSMVQYPKMLW